MHATKRQEAELEVAELKILRLLLGVANNITLVYIGGTPQVELVKTQA